jgi:hypothetical protein
MPSTNTTPSTTTTTATTRLLLSIDHPGALSPAASPLGRAYSLFLSTAAHMLLRALEPLTPTLSPSPALLLQVKTLPVAPSTGAVTIQLYYLAPPVSDGATFSPSALHDAAVHFLSHYCDFTVEAAKVWSVPS